jgi:hypothetical protein
VGCQAQAVADGIVGVVVVLAGGVLRIRQAIERVVGIADDAVGGGQGRSQRHERRCGSRNEPGRGQHHPAARLTGGRGLRRRRLRGSLSWRGCRLKGGRLGRHLV